jgi:L-alanine-DL-glutamate epimerase-like enolase superfamily enzyme
VDIACWDIQGKAFGVRACDLLGGAFQEQVPCYSSIDVVPPEQAAERAKEHIAQGYRRVQLKVGGRTLEEDLAAVRKVSEVIKPGIALVVDANGGWTVREAVLASLQCRDLPVVLEQPCRTYEEVLALRGRIAHPVLLDEAAEDLGLVLRSINDRAADGFSLKCTRIGGLSAMRTIRDVCRCAGLPLTCDDAWGGDVIAAACVHLGATVEPRLFEGSWIAAPHIEGHYDHENGPRPLHGHIALPRGPGLGIVPDISQWGEPVLSFA